MWNAGNTTTNVNIKTGYFGNLEKSILIYKGKGDTFITGDLNARAGKRTKGTYTTANLMNT